MLHERHLELETENDKYIDDDDDDDDSIFKLNLYVTSSFSDQSKLLIMLQ